MTCPKCKKPVLAVGYGSTVFSCGSIRNDETGEVIHVNGCRSGWENDITDIWTERRPEPVEELPQQFKIVTCPECSEIFERPVVLWEGAEIMATRGCLCDACEAKREAAVSAVNARERHLVQWRTRMPEDYHRADPAKVSPALRVVQSWRPVAGVRRLGISGAPGAGKSMAVAAMLRDFVTPFQWTNGFAARSIYNFAVSGSDEQRHDAGIKWRRFRETPLLVLDDVDKGNFTEAWAGALFDLLEHRNGACLATVWTANLGPGPLAKKIGLKSGDTEQAEAIERRLCDGALLLAV